MSTPPSQLKAKVLKLAHDLSAFLDEQQNPKLDPRVLRNQPWEEAYKRIVKAGRPQVEAIHSGYMSKFRQRTIDLFNELAQHQIHVPEIHAWEIDPPEMMPEKNVRKIADRLVKLAASMEPSVRPKLTEPETLAEPLSRASR
jgi:hypothetical protein